MEVIKDHSIRAAKFHEKASGSSLLVSHPEKVGAEVEISEDDISSNLSEYQDWATEVGAEVEISEGVISSNLSEYPYWPTVVEAEVEISEDVISSNLSEYPYWPTEVGAEVEISEGVISSNLSEYPYWPKEVTKSDVEAVIRKQDTHDLYCPNCRSCITKTVILSRRKPRLSEHDKQEITNVLEIIEDELDVEGVVKKQETHDLICPNCNSCITKRVILRRRNDESLEQLTPENVTYVPLRDEGQSGVDNISSIEDDREKDVFRCLSCFSFFIPTGDGFKLFRNTQNNENTSLSFVRTTTSAVVKGTMEVKAKLHEVEEEAGGLSLLVSSPKQVGASYIDEGEVENWEDVIKMWNATRIHLMNKDVTELPESPDCPNLTSLFLQTNSDLTSIPASFFEHIPNLKEVDLSDTGIKSLPRSFFDLVSLQKLFLRNCQVFMELPAEIGQLHNLEVLDLEGTDIIQLPAEIGDLVKLTCLKVSFCQWSCDLGETTMFPEGALSKLAQLIELCIDVDPEDSRWEGAVKVVIKELVHLKKLRNLKMYLPQVELLDELTRNLPFLLGSSTTGYNLNVGSHMRRVMSPTPFGAEGKSEHTKKQLRYVNGEGSIPSQVKKLLKNSDALFLDRHFTVTNLSEFGMHNMENLRYCMLGECNELRTIVQGDDDDDEYKYPVLPELEQLIIYDMKTLTCIYNARPRHDSLRRLKVLKLHGCVQLRTIFVFEAGIGLVHLEEITVEDCPAVLSLVTYSSPSQIRLSFPRLKKISLHYLTELQSIFSGLCIAPCLERLSVYDCPNLKTLSAMDISTIDGLKVIRGEEEWWEALEWNESEREEGCLEKLASVFVPIRSDADLETQLAQDPIPDQSGKERALARQHRSSMATSLVQSNKAMKRLESLARQHRSSMATSLVQSNKAMKRLESKKSYSWWRDSHIRPKNSKWLADNLDEMEKSVKHMFKLIEEDADSFAKRAETYYKKRHELMAHVEELYRKYRALAERYDHVTGELQKNVPSDLQYQVQSNKAMKRLEPRKSHSWWWDSHIGPKNSRWLADNLDEMDKSVKHMVKLLEEDADSFAKRAEIYYKKRPQLMAHVEEFYRKYRALAEHYDHVTGELEKNDPSDSDNSSEQF